MMVHGRKHSARSDCRNAAPPDHSMTFQHIAEVVGLAFTISGSIYVVLCGIAGTIFRRRLQNGERATAFPPVTILKPLYGADKELLENLRSACLLDYPEYQVVLSVQRLDDPAIAIMQQVQKEFGEARVTLAIAESEARTNGKIQNLEIAYPHARYDIMVISDSDIRLRPDYLKAIIAPFADDNVGCVSTPYRAIHAHRWFEKLELLTMNADFVPNLIFTSMTRLTAFGLGASMAFRRRDLDAIGGFAAFRDYLAEDSQIALRIKALGRRVTVAPYFVDMEVDLRDPSDWWRHELYWDLNTRVVWQSGFIATIVVRSIPCALLYALARGFDLVGLEVFLAATALRIGVSAYLLGAVLDDREGVAALWLLPLRDLLGVVFWFLAIVKRDFVRRGKHFGLLPNGRIVPKPAQ
jgi:ceramide glucosyltransferase